MLRTGNELRESLEGVRSLIEFYKTNAAQITEALNR
jgi:hypothetical protein